MSWRRPAWVALGLLVGANGSIAHASVWPSAASRVARELHSEESSRRVDAVRELAPLALPYRVQLLPQALASPDVAVRVAAAAIAAHSLPERHLALILPWLSAEPLPLRLAAVRFIAATRLGARTTRELTRALADPEPEVRATAARAFGRAAVAEAVMVLLGRISDPDETVQIAILEALQELRDPRAVVPLAARLSAPQHAIRIGAARALVAIQSPSAEPALIGALTDQDAEVRRLAALGLGRLGAPSATSGVTRCLSDEDADVRRQCALSLLLLPGDGARVLVSLLADSTRVAHWPTVLDAVARAPEPQRVRVLGSLDDSLAPEVGSAVLRVLARTRTPGATELAVDWRRRSRLSLADAVEVAGLACDPKGLSLALEGLGDRAPALRRRARAATVAILSQSRGDGRAVEPLADALAIEPNATARRELVKALGLTRSPRALPALLALLPADNPESASAIAGALGSALGGLGASAGGVPRELIHEAEHALLTMLARPDGVVASTAAWALREGATSGAAAPIFESLDRGLVQREHALVALAGAARGLDDPALIQRITARASETRGQSQQQWLEVLLALPAPRWSVLSDTLAPASLLTVAERLGSRPDSAATLRALMGHRDARVAAAAAWSLGSVGVVGDARQLARAAQSQSPAVATNAMAGLVRLALRTGGVDSGEICSGLSHLTPLVRANALAGVRLLGASCSAPLAPYLQDPSAAVREQAARLLLAQPTSAEGERWLAACRFAERSPRVSLVCHQGPEPQWLAAAFHPGGPLRLQATGPHAHPGRSLVLLMGSGLRRIAILDRNAHVYEPDAPPGVVLLEPAPAAL